MSAPVHAGMCLPGGGVCPNACLDVSARGVSAPVHAGIHTHPVNRMTDRQTGVKTLPCRNRFADGNQGFYTYLLHSKQ